MTLHNTYAHWFKRSHLARDERIEIYIEKCLKERLYWSHLARDERIEISFGTMQEANNRVSSRKR